MPISNFSDIPGYLGGWDASDSAPSASSTTGLFSSMGTDLAGAGSVEADFNGPRYQNFSGGIKGMLCPPNNDQGANKCGLSISLAGAPYRARDLMIVMLVTPLSMVGDNTQGRGRAFITDNATRTTGPYASAMKGFQQGGSPLNGPWEINGGSSSQNTVGETGCERQLIGFRGNGSGTNTAFGYVNADAASENTTGANTGTTQAIAFVDVGAWVATPGNNHFPGVIEAVHVYHQSGGYTEQNVIDVMNLIKSNKGLVIASNLGFFMTGDSIGFGSATIFDTQLSNWTSKVDDTVASNASAGATALALVSSTGFSSVSGSNRYIVNPGTATEERITVSSISVNTLNLATALKYDHTAGEIVVNDGYGFTTPHANFVFLSKMVGDGTGAKNFNYSIAGAFSSGISYPAGQASDGSFANFSNVSTAIYCWQRVSNDIKGGATGATCQGYARTGAVNARAAGADYVLCCTCLDRADFSAGNRTQRTNYNTLIAADVGTTYWDAVVNWDVHELLANCELNTTGSITVSGATGATLIFGEVFDAAGVHPRTFGQACQALVLDKVIAGVLGQSVPYSITTPVAAVRKVPTGAEISWATPTSPNAPKKPHTTYPLSQPTDGPSFLRVKVYRDGVLIATVAPYSISCVNGAVDWTGRLSYTDTGYTAGSSYTVKIFDAAGNESASSPVLRINSGTAAKVAADMNLGSLLQE